MPESLTNLIIDKIDQASGLYHNLVLVVAPAGSGKTAALREVQAKTGTSIININLELSSRLVELSARQRILQMPKLLSEIVTAQETSVILLDNTELLFDVSLRQDPLKLLQGLSRNKTIVASWNGFVERDQIIYASPEHHEFRRYQIKDFLIVQMETD